MLLQVGELASSKSAMKPRAPEFSALMTILRLVGPVISTRRSWSASGTGATVKSSGAATNSSVPPASSSAWRSGAPFEQLAAPAVELAVEAREQRRARPR